MMKKFILIKAILLILTFTVRGQTLTDTVSIHSITKNHVLSNNVRLLIYPTLEKASEDLLELNNELADKRLVIVVSIYEDRVIFKELKGSKKIPEEHIKGAKEFLKQKLRFLILDDFVLRNADSYDIAFSLNIRKD